MRQIITSHPKKTTAAAMAVAATLVSGYEGYYGNTYRDIVGVPTVCYGETEGPAVEEGRHRKFTKAECLDMLKKRLVEYDTGVSKCMTRDDVPESVRIAAVSFSYNVGIRGACRSTFMIKLNRGDYRGACDALMMWNKAGGRVVRGLTNRRADERRVCLQGV